VIAYLNSVVHQWQLITVLLAAAAADCVCGLLALCLLHLRSFSLNRTIMYVDATRLPVLETLAIKVKPFITLQCQ